jgi:hypothetical protein
LDQSQTTALSAQGRAAAIEPAARRGTLRQAVLECRSGLKAMKVLMPVVIAIGAVVAAAGIGVAGLLAWQAYERAHRKHDPVEYYSRWGGYTQPVTLANKITKAEADALAAAGYAYLIASFDTDGHLTRVVKMLDGAVFFDLQYTYHRNGKLKTATLADSAKSTVLDYDERGRLLSNVRTPAASRPPSGD